MCGNCLQQILARVGDIVDIKRQIHIHLPKADSYCTPSRFTVSEAH